MGRNSYWCLRYGVSRLVAFDYDERSVAATKKTLKDFPTAVVRQGDIETFNTEERFDLVISIGVIHHLEQPHKALANLARLLKPGGKLLIWVYGYEGNEWIVRYVNPIRSKITSRLPIGLTHALSYLCSVPLYLYVRVIPQKYPYLRQLSTFGFRHVHSIVFDQLLPRVANYWKRSEIVELMRSVPDIGSVEIHPVNEMSWTAIGTKR
jgi:SAM-dependent methyltransferase